MGERLGARGAPGRGGGLAVGLCPAPCGGCRPVSFQNTSWPSTPFPPPAGSQKLRQLVLAPSWVHTLSEGGTGLQRVLGSASWRGRHRWGHRCSGGGRARPQRGWALQSAGAQAKGQSARRGRDTGPGAPAASRASGPRPPDPPPSLSDAADPHVPREPPGGAAGS